MVFPPLPFLEREASSRQALWSRTMSQEGWAHVLPLPGALGGKSEPCETLGLELNHMAKTANLVLGFPLA